MKISIIENIIIINIKNNINIGIIIKTNFKNITTKNNIKIINKIINSKNWTTLFNTPIHVVFKILPNCLLYEIDISTSAKQIHILGLGSLKGPFLPLRSLFRISDKFSEKNTIGDEGITVDFWIIKVHTSNWSSNSWGS